MARFTAVAVTCTRTYFLLGVKVIVPSRYGLVGLESLLPWMCPALVRMQRHVSTKDLIACFTNDTPRVYFLVVPYFLHGLKSTKCCL